MTQDVLARLFALEALLPTICRHVISQSADPARTWQEIETEARATADALIAQAVRQGDEVVPVGLAMAEALENLTDTLAERVVQELGPGGG